MQTRSMMLAGGAAIAVIALAAVLLRPMAPTPETVDPAQQAGVSDEVAGEGADGSDAVGAPVPANMASDSPEQGAVAPLITDFRFEPDGALLVSGRAQPDMLLAIMVDGTEVDRTQAAADGSFIIAAFVGYANAPRRMALIADPDGAALAAERSFVLDANPAPLMAEPEMTPDTEVEMAAEATVQAPALPAVDASAAEAAPVQVDETQIEIDQTATMEPVLDAPQEAAQDPVPEAPQEMALTSTPTILALDADGVRVVQAPVAVDAPPEVMSTVALDSITYDAEGEVILIGRAPSEGFVQVYIDNAPISRLEVGDDGQWRTDLPQVDKGVYTLRIDEVGPDGGVVSRIETPFQREAPEDVAAAMAEQTSGPAFTVATRTVQPGATLWAIAEERYGSGVQYLTVFEANRDRIRNPDLIYPGQVFVIPEATE